MLFIRLYIDWKVIQKVKGDTGYENAKYWITGGPKRSITVFPSSGSDVVLVYEVLIEYLVQRHPDLVESLISSSDKLQYEIIADGGRCRNNITVPPYSWNGMALIDLWALSFTYHYLNKINTCIYFSSINICLTEWT